MIRVHSGELLDLEEIDRLLGELLDDLRPFIRSDLLPLAARRVDAAVRSMLQTADRRAGEQAAQGHVGGEIAARRTTLRKLLDIDTTDTDLDHATTADGTINLVDALGLAGIDPAEPDPDDDLDDFEDLDDTPHPHLRLVTATTRVRQPPRHAHRLTRNRREKINRQLRDALRERRALRFRGKP